MKILVIGAGGIGSWLLTRLYRLEQYNQLPEDCEITVVDSDIVEEKNFPYQNFNEGDQLDYKASMMEINYGFTSLVKRVETEEDLEGYDILVCAVDNPQTRRLIYNYCDKTKTFFIDLRAEGRSVWGITSDAEWSLEKLLSTVSSEDKEGSSCQLEYELSAGIIQLGNTIIAEVGSQWILNKIRDVKSPVMFTSRF